jgi:uncharacterized protein CbrC (UPF0167 family)
VIVADESATITACPLGRLLVDSGVGFKQKAASAAFCFWCLFSGVKIAARFSAAPP